jgi:protein-tyrosine phosphatase
MVVCDVVDPASGAGRRAPAGGVTELDRGERPVVVVPLARGARPLASRQADGATDCENHREIDVEVDVKGAALAAAPCEDGPVAQRLDIPVTYNFREVTVPVRGGRLRPGRLFRSDALGRLTRDGRARLREIGVRRVIDMRSSFDRRLGGPDRLRGVGAELVAVPIDASGAVRDPSRLMLRDIYRVVLGQHGEQVGTAIRAVATSPGPVVVHCTAGKDRTGLVVALLLLALGARYDDVAADYAATTENLAGPWTERMVRRTRPFRVEITDGFLEVLARSPEPVLRDTLDWVESEYGGVPAYLSSIGVDDGVVALLRQSLVEEAELLG